MTTIRVKQSKQNTVFDEVGFSLGHKKFCVVWEGRAKFYTQHLAAMRFGERQNGAFILATQEAIELDLIEITD